MPNSRHSEAMLSPSLSRKTNRMRSSRTDRSFHGIDTSWLDESRQEGVNHVFGTFCIGMIRTHTRGFAERCYHNPAMQLAVAIMASVEGLESGSREADSLRTA